MEVKVGLPQAQAQGLCDKGSPQRLPVGKPGV